MSCVSEAQLALTTLTNYFQTSSRSLKDRKLNEPEGFQFYVEVNHPLNVMIVRQCTGHTRTCVCVCVWACVLVFLLMF